MIKGITPRLAEAGKIKIGGKGEIRKSNSGGEYRLPQKYDHFVLTKTQRDESGDLIIDTELMNSLPKDSDGEIRTIPIILHADDIDDVFPTSYASYDGKKILCRGDGEEGEHREKGPVKCDPETCPIFQNTDPKKPKCKPNGTLHCSIRVADRAVAGALHYWRTTSLISVQRMLGSLLNIQNTVGVLRNIPLLLKVEPVTVSPNGKTTTVYCCHVELHAADILQVQQAALDAAERRKALGAGDVAAYRALIQAPAGNNEDELEQRDIQEEFYPTPEGRQDPVGQDAREADPQDPPKQEYTAFDGLVLDDEDLFVGYSIDAMNSAQAMDDLKQIGASLRGVDLSKEAKTKAREAYIYNEDRIKEREAIQNEGVADNA